MSVLIRIGLILGCLCLFLYLGCRAPGYKESKKYRKAVEETKAVDENEQSQVTDEDLTFGVAPITAEMIYEEIPYISNELKEKCKDIDVWVKAYVNEEGKVEKADILKSVSCENDEMKAALDIAAVRAAYKCKYKPAIQDGKPVAVWVTYQVDFISD